MAKRSKPRSKDPLWLRVLPFVSVVVFLAIWEWVVRARGITPIILPAPSAIADYLWLMIADGSLPYHLAITFLRIMGGFLVASFLGITVGVLMGMSRVASRILDPWIAALYPLPKISLIPLLIIWLGTGEAYILTISAITAFFPVVISTYAGIRQADPGLLRAARDLGANERQVQMKVVIPAAIPSIFSGLHLGMGVTIILVVAAEMIGGSNQSGMGYLLIRFGQVMETEKVFAALVVLAVFGGVIIKMQERIDRWIAPWAAGKNR
jgi:ABC-type nitrate/sulfonate/bicarbonate transport system permease component